MPRTIESGPAEGDPAAARNDVVVVGPLAGAPQERELPRGDVLLSWRVVVPRPPGRSAPERAPSVDTLDCISWRGDIRRLAGSWSTGDVLEVSGSLRRRFWRGPAGAASRTEVEATRVRRVARAASAR